MLYNKKCVYFEWDGTLDDEEVIIADDISSLRELVEAKDIDTLRKVEYSGAASYPFHAQGSNASGFRFAYYDPNYRCKIAFEQGKTIQYRELGKVKWEDIENPTWCKDYEYRIKPEDGLKLGDVVTIKDTTVRGIITAVDLQDTSCYVAGCWRVAYKLEKLDE